MKVKIDEEGKPQRLRLPYRPTKVGEFEYVVEVERQSEEAQSENADPSVVPIGIPLIAGAGALSTVMVLAGQARGQMYAVALALAILVNVIITLVVLLALAGSVIAAFI